MILTLLTDIADAIRAQCDSIEHRAVRLGSKRALVAGMATHGLVARWRDTPADGEVIFRVVVDRPIVLRLDGPAARSYNQAAGLDQPYNAQPTPDYESVARDLTPREVTRLSAMATDRRTWLADYPPRVGRTEFHIVPLAVPGTGQVVVVACEGIHRRRYGMAFQAQWLYVPAGPGATHTAEEHAVAWARQWADRIESEEERAFGGPPNLVDVDPDGWLDRSPRLAHRRAESERRRAEHAAIAWEIRRDAYDRWLHSRPRPWPDTSTVTVTDADGNRWTEADDLRHNELLGMMGADEVYEEPAYDE